MNRKDAELLAKEAFTYSGYHVKTIQWRSNRLDTRFWSLGEEWERNFAKLQNLPPRHCVVKHKMKGGMLPLRTKDIAPAYEVLGMNPEQYLAYLERLPFGKTYLRERASLARHPAQTQSAYPHPQPARETPSSPPLAESEQALLTLLIEHPALPVAEVYKTLGLRPATVTKIRERLTAQGLLQELTLRSTSPTGGRPTKYLIPTLQAFALLGKAPPAGRGGIIHRHAQQLVHIGATKKGYRVQVEKALENGAVVDVLVQKEGRTIAVEIAVVSTPEREIAHITTCLASG
jgi:DNA-binding MarR family transcriptional regulator